MYSHKILDIDSLAMLALDLRQEGKNVVLCHGTFDLMHTGHIRYLQSAKRKGDILIVTVTADKFVNKVP